MRPHHDYVLVGRRAALTATFRPCSTIFARRCIRLDPQAATRAFSSDVDAGSPEDNAPKRNDRAAVLTSVRTELSSEPDLKETLKR